MTARLMGQRGHVETMVERVAAANGARVVRDVLIDLTVTTADYSYIVVDQYGLLIVDVETWPGAEVHGGSNRKTWRARYRKAPRQSFANPLSENARRVDVLLEALLAFGRRIPCDYVADLVVFVDADIHALSLTDAEQARTVDAADAEAALRARYDFAINYGAVERDEIDGIVSVLQTINRFDTPEAAARHAVRRRARTPLRLRWRKPTLEVGLADATLGIAPTAPRLSQSRYPGIAAPPAKRVPVAGLLALLAVVGLAAWLFLFDGYGLVTQRITDSMQAPTPAPAGVGAPVQAPRAPTVSVDLAKSRLLEVSPEIYSTVANPDAPEIAVAGDLTTFTWHYVAKVSNNAAQARTISLTIGSDGRVVGMASGK